MCNCNCLCLPPGYRLTSRGGTPATYGFAHGSEYPHGDFATEAEAVRAAVEHHCRSVALCKPQPQLQAAVLFKVSQRVKPYGSLAGWNVLGWTHDLSLALAYQDRDTTVTWISVQRGFVDEQGSAYGLAHQALATLKLRPVVCA